MRVMAALAAIAIASCATTPTAPTAPTTVGFAPFCTTEGALGQMFGPDPDFNGETNVLAHTREPAAAPFHSLEIGRSRLSGVTHTITGSTLIYTGDYAVDAAARERTYLEFRARIEASGAFELDEETRYGAVYFAVQARDSPPLRLTLRSSYAGRVSMSCSRPDLFQVAWNEMPDDVRAGAEEARRRIEAREAARELP